MRAVWPWHGVLACVSPGLKWRGRGLRGHVGGLGLGTPNPEMATSLDEGCPADQHSTLLAMSGGDGDVALGLGLVPGLSGAALQSWPPGTKHLCSSTLPFHHGVPALEKLTMD